LQLPGRGRPAAATAPRPTKTTYCLQCRLSDERTENSRKQSEVVGVRWDVANLADLDRLYATVKEKHGRLDVLFANAGGREFAPLGQITEGHFDKTFNSNVKGLRIGRVARQFHDARGQGVVGDGKEERREVPGCLPPRLVMPRDGHRHP
jgi:NAD(P)-dependent dehydrogenase (short-subunit alcohol dehydrogenase family)